MSYSNNNKPKTLETDTKVAVLEFFLYKNGNPLQYCINIDSIVEVADFPKVISEVSSTNDFVYGIINIRKNVFIPLYNIAYRLHLDYQFNPEASKVVVL